MWIMFRTVTDGCMITIGLPIIIFTAALVSVGGQCLRDQYVDYKNNSTCRPCSDCEDTRVVEYCTSFDVDYCKSSKKCVKGRYYDPHIKICDSCHNCRPDFTPVHVFCSVCSPEEIYSFTDHLSTPPRPTPMGETNGISGSIMIIVVVIVFISILVIICVIFFICKILPRIKAAQRRNQLIRPRVETIPVPTSSSTRINELYPLDSKTIMPGLTATAVNGTNNTPAPCTVHAGESQSSYIAQASCVDIENTDDESECSRRHEGNLVSYTGDLNAWGDRAQTSNEAIPGSFSFHDDVHHTSGRSTMNQEPVGQLSLERGQLVCYAENREVGTLVPSSRTATAGDMHCSLDSNKVNYCGVAEMRQCHDASHMNGRPITNGQVMEGYDDAQLRGAANANTMLGHYVGHSGGAANWNTGYYDTRQPSDTMQPETSPKSL